MKRAYTIRCCTIDVLGGEAPCIEAIEASFSNMSYPSSIFIQFTSNFSYSSETHEEIGRRGHSTITSTMILHQKTSKTRRCDDWEIWSKVMKAIKVGLPCNVIRCLYRRRVRVWCYTMSLAFVIRVAQERYGRHQYPEAPRLWCIASGCGWKGVNCGEL